MRRKFQLVLALLLTLGMAMAGTRAYAQGAGTTTSLSGTVIDTSGGVIPGAGVTARNNATATEFQAVTGNDGKFIIPALDPGTYTLTISLMGFKTWSAPDVKIIAATPATVKATLEVGKLEETVVVRGATEIVQTQNGTVASTLTTSQITNVPLVTRNTMDFLTQLPGVDTTSSARNALVNGLRASATNITIDGINTQDNYLKSSDGFFSRISPRMDAVEEVTVSTANPGAESAGQGAVQIRFVTRSGTNQFTGSAYEYNREPQYNSNYWFSTRDHIAKQQVKINTYGFRQGGPIVIPGLFDGHDKAFFFFNYEEFRQPTSVFRNNRVVLSPAALNGDFTYGTSSPRTVNLLALAAAKGQTSTPDPTINALWQDIFAAMQKSGTIGPYGTDPNRQLYSNNFNSMNLRRFPTMRFDVNVTPKNRAGFVYYYQQYSANPDTLNSYEPAFPGFPNYGAQTSGRWSATGNLRTTLTSNMVNEIRAGGTGGPVQFSTNVTKSDFTGSLANQNGFNITMPYGLFYPTQVTAPNTRDAPNYFVDNTLSWIKGSHSLTMGGSFTQINLNYITQTVVPSVSLGVDSSDPAYGMFTTTNFPGASTTDLGNARNLYAVLTGRVTQVSESAVLDSAGNYQILGQRTQLAHMREFGVFLQDQWRLRPNFTVNFGARYELQMPFVALNSAYSQALSYANVYGVSGLNPDGTPNVFNPGVTYGTPTQFTAYKAGTQAYPADKNNIAPSTGIAWKLGEKQGFWKKLLGDDSVIRGGYSLSYIREGMAAFSDRFSNNLGGTYSANRNMTLGNLLGAGETLPVLFRDSSRLGPGAVPAQPQWPLNSTLSNNVNAFDPSIVVPYTHSYTIGFQRALNKNTAVEIRYVGNANIDGWGTNNKNEINIKENGFLDEFKLAQKNLLANQAFYGYTSKGNTFAYTGAPGTAPLPIMLAYFQGLTSDKATTAANYTSSAFSNSNYINWLSPLNSQPYCLANSCSVAGSTVNGIWASSSYRANGKTAGLPANFFVVNPDASSVNVTENGPFTHYDSMQIELRRRMSNGLLVSGSYVLATGTASTFYSIRNTRESARNTSLPRHTAKVNWVYELPFGQGKRFGSGVSRGLNRLIGGWSFDGAGTVRSGNIMDFGHVNLVGMTDADLQSIYKLQFRQDPTTGLTQLVYMLPQDIVDNTIKAYSIDVTSPTGYSSLGVPSGRYFAPVNTQACMEVSGEDQFGKCAPVHHYVTGPAFVRFDMSIAKRLEVTSRVNVQFRVEALNVFDNVNFTPNSYIGTTALSYQVRSAYTDINNTQDPGGRLLQLSFRISW